MLLEKKRIAVVSNNNSATANVLEKLEKYELDFVTAFLGSAENKTTFIEGQTGAAIQMPTLQSNKEGSVRKEISRLNQELDKAFEMKNELASVIQQVDALRLEWSHFKGFQEETNGADLNERIPTFQPNVSAKKLMRSWLAFERKSKRRSNANLSSPPSSSPSSHPHSDSQPAKATKQHVGLLEKIRLLFRFGMAGRVFFQLSIEERIPLLQKAYYLRKLADLEGRRKTLERSL